MGAFSLPVDLTAVADPEDNNYAPGVVECIMMVIFRASVALRFAASGSLVPRFPSSRSYLVFHRCGMWQAVHVV